ncbi:MAG: PDZ domain-containing protein [Planctomycetota bacterium]
MRTLTILGLVAALAAAQEASKLDRAKAAIVGVQAQRTIEMRGRSFPTRVQQAGVLIGKGIVLTPALGNDAQDVKVHVAGGGEPLDAEVLDSDTSYSILSVEGAPDVKLEFVRDWKPAPGQKLVWIGVLGPAGKWTPVAREASVDALIDDDTGPLVYSDPPFSGPVLAGGGIVLNAAGDAIGLIGVKRNERQGGNARRMMRRQTGLPVVFPAARFAAYLDAGAGQRGVLGITAETLSAKVAEAMGLEKTRGVIVTQVTPGSAAQAAGIEAQDIIVSVAGKDVGDLNGLMQALRGKKAGETVKVKIVRLADTGKVDKELEATLTAREKTERSDRLRAQRFGFTAEPLTDAVRRSYQLPADLQGVHVRRVVAGGAAAMGRPTPLRRGDVILKVGQAPVGDIAALRKALKAAENGKPVTLFVRHATETRFVEMTPEKSE